MNQKNSPLRLFIRSARPFVLAGGALFYFVGVGIAKYLGLTLQVPRLIVGLVVIELLLLTSHFLKTFYDAVAAQNATRPYQLGDKRNQRDPAILLSRQVIFLAAASAMTVGAALTVLLLQMGALNLAALLILGFAFLLAFFYGVPPVSLAYSGIGEFSESVLMASLIPTFAYLLQGGSMHQLVLMITFPLLALYLAARLALSLENYLLDVKNGQRTLMVMLGWQRGMNIHNLLILFAYIFIAISAVFGLPAQLTWPELLPLPLGGFAIYQITQVAAGSKPGWRLINLTAIALPALTAYFVTFALWTG